jgi:hypothetical protein
MKIHLSYIFSLISSKFLNIVNNYNYIIQIIIYQNLFHKDIKILELKKLLKFSCIYFKSLYLNIILSYYNET